MGRLRVLFLCTGNSCRSQMAEGFARALKGDLIEPYSAGTRPAREVHPLAVKVMEEVGIDISKQRPKPLEELLNLNFDYVVTVCDGAASSCPVFPGRAKVVHRSFEDPPRLAASARSEEEALEHFRRVRDKIRAFIETLPEGLDDLSAPPLRSRES